MEDILKKDIFSDKELQKYSPDYSSQEIYLRMQLRREMAKDSHVNGIKVDSNKNNIKKTRDCFKYKKELVKLRTYFQNMNLKNQSSLKERKCLEKNTTKFNKSLKLALEHEPMKNDIGFLDDLLEDKNVDKELVIENDSDFKLIQKEITQSQSTSVIKKSMKIENKTKINNINNISLNEIKITESSNTMSKMSHENDRSDVVNEYKQDLQSLLIMMTINSNTDDNIESDHDFSNTESHSIFPNDDNCTSDLHKTSLSQYSPNANLDQILNITPAVKKKRQRQKYLSVKYISLWRINVNKNKENRMYEQRRETLNQFFDKLSKKKSNSNNHESTLEPIGIQKAKNLARDYNTYQHRYKVQKHIIALQKAKLEQQNKVIEQLKYNKIVDASRQSLDTMKEDVRRTYYEIDKHLMPKIKNLTNELKIKEFEEPSLVLHCLKVPQFLQRMEARAREREEKHAVIRERRQQMEEERIRQKQQAELAKMEMDKEEKIKRMKELKEKRKKEKIENIRKKQHVERMRALMVMSDLHYERSLMGKYGIRPLRRLMELKQDNLEKAKSHYRFQLLKNIFLHWMWHTEDMWYERNYKAEDLYRKNILKRGFTGFKKNHYEFILKKQVAEDYYDLYVTNLIFHKFRHCLKIIKQEHDMKWKKATIYYNSNILFKTFICWRSLPALNNLKREQEVRKLRWREKVLLVVPDYNPPDD